jgi:hypothetical protein
MRVRLNASFLVLWAITGGCAPEQKCSGKQYYDPVIVGCRLCPMDATFKNGTCECKGGSEFVKNRCVLLDGAVLETPDTGTADTGTADTGAADTGAADTATCETYCDFAKVCLGENTLAAAALPDVITGLHADDTAACTSSCKSDLGREGAGDPVVACVEAGRDEAACAGDSSQAGLSGAFMLLADCCRPRRDNALCKSICKPLKANALVAGMVDFCD